MVCFALDNARDVAQSLADVRQMLSYIPQPLEISDYLRQHNAEFSVKDSGDHVTKRMHLVSVMKI